MRVVVAYLVAQSLHIALSQLLAAHEALNPAIQGGNCGRLGGWDGRQLHGLGHLDVLHIGVHGCGTVGEVAAGGVAAWSEVDLSRGSCPSNLADDVWRTRAQTVGAEAGNVERKSTKGIWSVQRISGAEAGVNTGNGGRHHYPLPPNAHSLAVMRKNCFSDLRIM